MSKFSYFLREPLVLFLAIGAVLFSLDALRPPAAPPPEEIWVTAGQIKNMSGLFARTWRRPPNNEELDTLIENHIREEIIVREATALGLDRDDAIIRRRLVQKYEFLTEDISELRQPSEEELTAFLAAEEGRYRIPANYSFRQVFLSQDSVLEDVQEQVAQLKAELEGGGDPRRLGDAIGLPNHIRRADETRIAATFGQPFADALYDLPIGVWSGPILSAYGAHLVLIEAREVAHTPSLAEIRTTVERDWRRAEQFKLQAQLLDQLRQNYRILIEPHALRPKDAAS